MIDFLSKLCNKISNAISKISGWMSTQDLSPEREEELLDNLANEIVRRKLDEDAILEILKGMKRFSYQISYLGLITVPFLDLFGINAYEYAILFEKPENVERLVKKIEEYRKQNNHRYIH